MGSEYADFTLCPLNTSHEKEFLHRQLCKEMRTGVESDRLIAWTWKTIKSMFTCIAPGKKIPQLEPRNFSKFSMPNEA